MTTVAVEVGKGDGTVYVSVYNTLGESVTGDDLIDPKGPVTYSIFWGWVHPEGERQPTGKRGR